MRGRGAEEDRRGAMGGLATTESCCGAQPNIEGKRKGRFKIDTPHAPPSPQELSTQRPIQGSLLPQGSKHSRCAYSQALAPAAGLPVQRLHRDALGPLQESTVGSRYPAVAAAAAARRGGALASAAAAACAAGGRVEGTGAAAEHCGIQLHLLLPAGGVKEGDVDYAWWCNRCNAASERIGCDTAALPAATTTTPCPDGWAAALTRHPHWWPGPGPAWCPSAPQTWHPRHRPPGTCTEVLKTHCILERTGARWVVVAGGGGCH